MPNWLSDVTWHHSHALAGRTFRWGRLGDDYVGDWTGVLVVRADANGTATMVRSYAEADRNVVEKVTNGEAAAFLRAIKGRVSLHASSVVVDGRGLLMTGQSGAGKSTIAGRLCDDFGAELLADDVAGVDLACNHLRLEPSERALWLDDGTGVKVPLPARVASQEVDLALFVFLRFDDTLNGLATQRIHGAEVVPRVLESLLRFDPAPDLWGREFDLLARFASGVPMLDLARPRVVSSSQTAASVVRLMEHYAQGRVS